MKQLANIQALRAYAALGVVCYHSDLYLPGARHTDFLGVSIFFAISGFIMTYIARTDAATFLINRIIRIVPLYWILSLAWAALVVFIYPLIGKPTINVVSISTLLQDLFFIPKFDAAGNYVQPVLSVGWTLNQEMFFYIVFAACIFVNRKYAPVLAAFGLALLWIAARFFNLPPLLEFWGGPQVIQFVIGIIAYYLIFSTQQSRGLSFASLGIGAAILLTYIATENSWAALAAPFFIFFGAASLDIQSVSFRYKPILFIGTASYSLYLSHMFVMGFIRVASISPNTLALVAIGASLIVASLVYLLIEKPASKLFKRKPASVTSQLAIERS